MPATTLFDRAVIRLSGDDVRGFLQGLITNDVTGTLPVWAGLLTPQGKVLFDFMVWAEGEDLLVDCEATQAESLIRRLSLYRLRRTISIIRDERRAVHWSLSAPERPHDPRLAALGHRWIADPDPPGAAPANRWHAHRLSLGVAEGVRELGSGENLWLECNAAELAGVSFSKGCYVGQENTARMNWRQKVNRRLVVIHDGDAMRVERLRVADIAGTPGVVLPDWLKQALG